MSVEILGKEYPVETTTNFVLNNRYMINEIPSNVFQLVNLENLNLSFNILTTIPTEIKNLTKLKKINLCTNKFKEFPSELLEMSNLEDININVNKDD